jgi:hypothetical protein
MVSNDRNKTAKEVRQRRDSWLATMLDNVREKLPLKTSSRKCVADILLTDHQEGLTQREYYQPYVKG